MRATNLDALFKTAGKLHEQGRLAEAERLYLAVLKARPRDYEVLNALATLALQSGRLEVAVQHLKAAVAVRPDVVVTRLNLGTALRHFGYFEAALVEYDAAIALNPSDAALCAISWASRGDVLRNLRRLDEAIESVDQALAVCPDQANAWNSRGRILHERVLFTDAITAFDRAIALDPNDADFWLNRSVSALELRLPAAAIQSLDRVLALRPGDAGAWSNRGNALRLLGRFEEAVAAYDRATGLQPNLADAWSNRGSALSELGRASEAIGSLERALALRPDHLEALNNLGSALFEAGRSDEAIQSLKRALALRPNYPDALNSLGYILFELGHVVEAERHYDRALELRPGYSGAHFNRSLLLLLVGRFELGWSDYEHRKWRDHPVANRAYLQPPLADTTNRQGKTVLIHAEQGLGDTLQFCRYLPMLEALGMRVLFSPQPQLRALLRGVSSTIEMVACDDPALRFDYHAPLMSLPLIFGTRLETIPGRTPYLAAEPECVAHWKDLIGEAGFRIGVSWRGRGGRSPLERSFTPDRLAALAAVPGVRLISLQKGDGEADLGAYSGLEIERLEGLDEGPDAFLDTAAAMQSLDLVVSSDTAVAHLAGALGRPTWVPLKHVPDWRWLLDRTDSPWYPTMRLFRQKTRGDWGPVFAEMEAALRQQLAG